MLTQQSCESRTPYANPHLRRGVVQFLCGIMCGLLSVTGVFGEVQDLTSNRSGVGNAGVPSVPSVRELRKGRDPFQRIHKRRDNSSAQRKARSEPPPHRVTPPIIPTVKNPSWKLLGIIHGPHSPQAVIQISPHERVFVRSGLEVVKSGWIIKNIRKEEVLLEYSLAKSDGRSQPQAFILSFSSLGQPS
jgi:hypothetical protein